MSVIVKVGKAGKRFLKKYILPEKKHYLGYTRRTERVCTDKRICAMTFDDGPMDMPAAPDRFNGSSLTDILLDTLEQYGAKGTFDVIGDTGENYPDTAGKVGTASWGGIKYDHYPDINQDGKGGAVNNPRLINRMISEGHQITSHGYRHIIFGKKAYVYGGREYLGTFEKAVDDLEKLDKLLLDTYGYKMTMHRPPHYVDGMQGGFTSYDVCEKMGYRYLAASFDGAGWLPSTLPDENAALEAEVRAMTEPMRRALESNPDFFCGQIIFQKDGYNMAKRTPVAYGLGAQLELLKEYGYTVVTVEELMAESPFADVGRRDPLFEKLCALEKDKAVAYTDNTVRLDGIMTVGELAMLLAPKEEALSRRRSEMKKLKKYVHPYFGAMDWCAEQGLVEKGAKPDGKITALPEKLFTPVSDFTRRSVYNAYIQ